MSGETLEQQVRALRASAGMSRSDHVAVVHVDGPQAFDLLEHASTRRLYLREGQLRHTLLLAEDAGVFADAYIGSADDGFYVVAEGPSEAQLVAWLDRLARERIPGGRVELRGLSGERVVFGIDGPYAWEIMIGLLGPAVLGMPYLTMMRRGELLCVRAGKTGEYGYLLIVPREEADAVTARLGQVGAGLGLVPVGLGALDVCSLENGHFSIRLRRETSLATPLTPIELQLQWRVTYDRDFVGAEALRARRAGGLTVRTTAFTADGSLPPGTALRFDDTNVGEVLAATFSPTLGTWVGSALLQARVAHPHLPLSASTDAGPVRLTTCTTPLVDNVSLHLDPHKHTYATRAGVTA